MQRVLIIAGSDSSGGAGIQADIKTVTALQGYAATAVTALTAQNTQGVFGIVGVEPAFIAQQITVVLQDVGADCIKTGMLHTAAVIDSVVDTLTAQAPHIPLVVDPVMYAKGGATLLEPAARQTLITRLIPRATVLTPNLPEASALTGLTVTDVASMEQAAGALLRWGPQAVLIKGGHLSGDLLTDVLATSDGVTHFSHPSITTQSGHGTGCTLASAIATGIAQGMKLHDAVARAIAYVQEALKTAKPLGQGCGPLNHGHTVQHFVGGIRESAV